MSLRCIAGLAILTVLSGCSAGDASYGLIVGRDGTGGSSGASAGSGGAWLPITDAGVPSALSAHVESPAGVTVKFVTLSCAGDCADVVAVAKGGFPPYSYTWENGSTDPHRRVCPAVTSHYQVTAKDTGVSSPEFERAPQTAEAPLTANVLDCRLDAGAPPPVDSGSPPPTGQLCVANPSFEGKPGISEVVSLVGDAWANCAIPGSPDYWDEKQAWNGQAPGGPRASDGATYMELFCAGGPTCNTLGLNTQESLGQALCAPIVAGTRYSFQVDLSYRPEGSVGTAGGLEVWGGAAQCGADELLWRSPLVTAEWQTYCASFVATRNLGFLQVKASTGYQGTTGVFVDHLVPVEGCSSSP